MTWILTSIDSEKSSLVSMKMTTQKGTLAYMAPEIYQSSSYGPEGRRIAIIKKKEILKRMQLMCIALE